MFDWLSKFLTNHCLELDNDIMQNEQTEKRLFVDSEGQFVHLSIFIFLTTLELEDEAKSMQMNVNEEVKYGSDIINEMSVEEPKPEPEPGKFSYNMLIKFNCHF
jgi:hypothetical protein